MKNLKSITFVILFLLSIRPAFAFNHLELGAANHVSKDKDLSIELALLERTLNDLVEKHDQEEINFFINDIDTSALTLTKNHMEKYVFDKHPYRNIKIISYPGDLFSLKIDSIRPNSVHLKNPGAYLLVDPNYSYAFAGSPNPDYLVNIKEIESLVKECAKFTDAGGIFLSITSNLEALKSEKVFPVLEENIMWEDARSAFAYSLDYRLDNGCMGKITSKCEGVWLLKPRT